MNPYKLINAFQQLKRLNSCARIQEKIANREWELKQSKCKMFPCSYPSENCMNFCFNCFDRGGEIVTSDGGSLTLPKGRQSSK